MIQALYCFGFLFFISLGFIAGWYYRGLFILDSGFNQALQNKEQEAKANNIVYLPALSYRSSPKKKG